MGRCRASLFNPQSLIKAHLLVAGRSASEWTPPQNVRRKLVQGAVVVVETSLRIESLYLTISAGREEFLRESFAVTSRRCDREHRIDCMPQWGQSDAGTARAAVCYSISYI